MTANLNRDAGNLTIHISIPFFLSAIMRKKTRQTDSKTRDVKAKGISFHISFFLSQMIMLRKKTNREAVKL